MNAAATTEILTLGNKVISSLNEAKDSLNSAERWGNKENLKAQCSFLTIIDGTKNRMAQATIDKAEEDLKQFSKLLADVSQTYADKLDGIKLPESIQSKSILDPKVSHEEYVDYQAQIDRAIRSVTDIMAALS